MNLQESIRKILREEFDDLNWADEIPAMRESWDMVRHVLKDRNRGNYAALNEFVRTTQVKVKIKDANAFAAALDGCGEQYLFDNNVYNAENFIFNISGVDNFYVSEFYCGNHEDFDYEKNRYDSILLKDTGNHTWSFWVIEPWLDLIFIPKQNV